MTPEVEIAREPHAAPAVRWREGAPEIRRVAEAWLAGALPERERMRDNPRRLVACVAAPRGGALVLKRFRLRRGGSHALRDRLKRWIGASPAEREWQNLKALHERGAPVAEPLALGSIEGGEGLLVVRHAEGPLAAERLREAAPAERRALLEALGEALVRIHRAGYAHGDCHPGNALCTPSGPLWIDLQHARRLRTARQRLADVGAFDHALRQLGLSLADRARARGAALGLARPYSRSARRSLRAAGRASLHHTRDRARGRARRARRAGRRFASAALEGARGLRLRAAPPALVAEALAAHRAALAAGDARVLRATGSPLVTLVEAAGRRVEVREDRLAGLARWRAVIVGTPAWRLWLRAHALRAREVDTPVALAVLEARRLLPDRAILIVEDLRPDRTALELAGPAPEAVADALARLVIALHRRGVDARALDAAQVRLSAAGDALHARLTRIERVRLRKRLGRRARLESLAALNASLPAVLPAETRRRAFARYANALPFRGGARRALEAVVRRSLAARGRWSGEDCALAREAGAPSPPR